MRPCGDCGRLPPPGEPYSPKYCRYCWLAANNPKYRDAWTPAPPDAPRTEGRPLRVAHVGPAMMRGGVERHALALAENFDPTRAVMVSVVVTTPDFDPAVAREFPCPVVRGGADEVRRAARGCDVMLHWGGFDPGWLDGCKPPVVIYLAHGEGDWTGAVLEASKSVTDHCIAVSKRAKLTAKGFPTTTVPNGVDPRKSAPTRPRAKVRESLGFAPGDHVALFLGRFSPEKRPENVIRAVQFLPPRHKALLVGWGKMDAELRALAAKLLPGRHAFATGRVGDYLHAADCMVIPSEREGGPLVLLEAMFASLPAIATNVGLVPEMPGGLFNIIDGTPEQIADAIAYCWACPSFADRARPAKEYAEEHCYASTMADRYCDVFERLWRRRGKPRSNLGVRR